MPEPDDCVLVLDDTGLLTDEVDVDVLEVEVDTGLLEVDCGVDLLEVDCGADWLEVDCGADWLEVDCGTDWLEVDCGTDWLEVDCGTDWLEVEFTAVSLDIGSREETSGLVCEPDVPVLKAGAELSSTDVGTETGSLSVFEALAADEAGCVCII